MPGGGGVRVGQINFQPVNRAPPPAVPCSRLVGGTLAPVPLRQLSDFQHDFSTGLDTAIWRDAVASGFANAFSVVSGELLFSPSTALEVSQLITIEHFNATATGQSIQWWVDAGANTYAWLMLHTPTMAVGIRLAVAAGYVYSATLGFSGDNDTSVSYINAVLCGAATWLKLTRTSTGWDLDGAADDGSGSPGTWSSLMTDVFTGFPAGMDFSEVDVRLYYYTDSGTATTKTDGINMARYPAASTPPLMARAYILGV